MYKFLTTILFILLAFISIPAFAGDDRIKFVGSIGGSSGGEKMYTGSYTDGSTFDIKAGGGIYINAGISYVVDPEFDIQTTLGYHTDSTSANNGNISFDRVPLEAIVFYNFDDSKIKLGVGLRKSLSAKSTTSGVATDYYQAHSYNSSLGQVIELQYSFNKKVVDNDYFALSLRYVSEYYKINGYDEKIDGSHVGLALVYYY
jgi:hypothetical protein